MNRPSSTAYNGAVKGAQVFLKIVTIATPNPPSAPTSTYGIRLAVPADAKNRFHVYIAPTSERISRKAVRLTVPLSVITPSPAVVTVPLPRSRKADAFKAGLPLRMVFAVGMESADSIA